MLEIIDMISPEERQNKECFFCGRTNKSVKYIVENPFVSLLDTPKRVPSCSRCITLIDPKKIEIQKTINASEAKTITINATNNSKNPFVVVSDMIEKAALEGKSQIIFTETPSCNFPSRVIAKTYFNNLGYTVSYRRFKDDDHRSGCYFEGNIYTISW